MADIIKVEMQLTTEAQRVDMMKRFGPWRHRMLARKSKRRRNSCGRGIWASYIFRDIFFAGRKC